MSRRASPTRIGFFLLGAILIVIIAVAALASNTWFQQRTNFISFFPESVNGLENGAPVKFQGVPVGTVKGIDIRLDQRDNTFLIPVEYDIDLKRLTTPNGTYLNLGDTVVLGRQVQKGLRAQLQMESFVTGVLYIELSYHSDTTVPKLDLRTKLPLVPTTPSLMASIGGGAGSLLSQVQGTLERVNTMLSEVNIKDINRAVVQSANAIQQLMASPELRATLREMPAATAQLNRTLAQMERLSMRADSAIDPMQTQLKDVSTEAVTTLQALRATLQETHGLLSADTGPGYALTDALTSMQKAADALTQLITSLQRNPDMLLRGKKPPKDQP